MPKPTHTTPAEEDYLKAIYKLSGSDVVVTTNALAAELGTSPASVTDMLKRMNDKQLVTYIPYKGVSLADHGQHLAIAVLRKHRLWEVFLCEKLRFPWDEVHELAEQLEHIKSPQLVARLDEFLGFPRFDPHGDPIPDANGKFINRFTLRLIDLEIGQKSILAAVALQDADFLRYLNRLKLSIGSEIYISERIPFDASLVLQTYSGEIIVNQQVAQNLIVELLS